MMETVTIHGVEYNLPPDKIDKFHVAPDVGLLKHLQESWKQELLVDYTIQVGDEEFKVHKIVMASVSDYFKIMLTGGMMESQTDKVRLEGLDSLAVSNVIEYIYTNRITGERASPEELLACAMYLQVSTAIEAATNMLQEKLDKKNCLDILTTFDTYSLTEAVDHTKKYISTNMDEIVKVHGPGRLMCEHLLVIIKMWMDGEWDLFLTIKDWVDVDYENRKQHLDSLMSHVRFSLLTPAQLEAVKKMKLYSEGSWQSNVQQAQDYHKQPVHKKMMCPTSVRSKPQPVCFSVKNPTTMHTLEENGHWKAIDVPTVPQFTYGVIAVLEFNNFLVVVEDVEEGTQTWNVFDTSTLMWSKMKGMNTRRYDFALVHDDRYLYVLGGTDGDLLDEEEEDEDTTMDTIERYDPGTNTWTIMTTKLPKPMHEFSACVCSGPFFSIYVAGGMERLAIEDEEYDYSTAMNCFNPHEDSATWHSKAPMLNAAQSYVMREMAFNGKDPVIVIMCEDLVIQYYDLQTDQWTMWNFYASLEVDWHWDEYGTILSHPSKNTLYVLNISENFPGTKKEPAYGVCGKWMLSKEDDDILGCPVDKFPVAQSEYIAAILTIPTPSKRIIPHLVPSEKMPATPSEKVRLSPSPSGSQAVSKASAKRYNLRKSKS